MAATSALATPRSLEFLAATPFAMVYLALDNLAAYTAGEVIEDSSNAVPAALHFLSWTAPLHAASASAMSSLAYFESAKALLNASMVSASSFLIAGELYSA